MQFVNTPDLWDQMIKWMEDFKCNNSIWSVLNRYLISYAVYYIWKERNDRVFSQNSKSVDVVVQNIKDQVRLQLMSLKVLQTVNTCKVAEIWKVQFTCS